MEMILQDQYMRGEVHVQAESQARSIVSPYINGGELQTTFPRKLIVLGDEIMSRIFGTLFCELQKNDRVPDSTVLFSDL